MPELSGFVYTQNVERRVPARVRVIAGLLYVATALFAIIGTMGGLPWGVLSVGSLVLAWYLMGQAKVSYSYELTGTRLTVDRTSGFRSRPVTERFCNLDLSRMRVMATEGDPALTDAERDTANLNPKRVNYDVSAHDRDRPARVMYLEGVGEEQGRWLKVRFQPDDGLVDAIRRACPGRVKG